MTGQRSRTLATFAAGLVALAGVMVGGPASAAPADGTSLHGGVTVDDAGRVDYNVDLSQLPGAVILTEQGVLTQHGSCIFDTAQRGKAGRAKILIITEISYDPTDCSRQIARAEYDRDSAPASVRSKIDGSPNDIDTAEQGSQAKGPATSGTIEPTAGPWSGSLKVNVEDPPQIDVTTTKSYLTWRYDGNYLYGEHRAEWGWFTGSGWERESYDWSYDNNGWYAYTDTTAHYRNGIFCFTIDTHTYHDQTYFEGWYDGYWYWSYSVNKSGGCTDLLHYEYIAETP